MPSNIMALKFIIDKQHISRIDRETPVEKSRHYLFAQFEFTSDEWNEIEKYVIFSNLRTGIKKTQMLNDSNIVEVPWEVLDSGTVEVSCFGGDLITNDVAKFFVAKSGYALAEVSEEPTPSIFEQIISNIDDTKKKLNSLTNIIDKCSADLISKPDKDYIDTEIALIDNKIDNIVSSLSDKADCFELQTVIDHLKNIDNDILVIRNQLLNNNIVIDSELSSKSTNTVQNSVITKALDEKQDLLIPGIGINIEDGVISSSAYIRKVILTEDNIEDELSNLRNDTIYFVLNENGDEDGFVSSKYDEYIYVNGMLEMIGTVPDDTSMFITESSMFGILRNNGYFDEAHTLAEAAANIKINKLFVNDTEVKPNNNKEVYISIREAPMFENDKNLEQTTIYNRIASINSDGTIRDFVTMYGKRYFYVSDYIEIESSEMRITTYRCWETIDSISTMGFAIFDSEKERVFQSSGFYTCNMISQNIERINGITIAKEIYELKFDTSRDIKYIMLSSCIIAEVKQIATIIEIRNTYEQVKYLENRLNDTVNQKYLSFVDISNIRVFTDESGNKLFNFDNETFDITTNDGNSYISDYIPITEKIQVTGFSVQHTNTAANGIAFVTYDENKNPIQAYRGEEMIDTYAWKKTAILNPEDATFVRLRSRDNWKNMTAFHAFVQRYISSKEKIEEMENQIENLLAINNISMINEEM